MHGICGRDAERREEPGSDQENAKRQMAAQRERRGLCRRVVEEECDGIFRGIAERRNVYDCCQKLEA